MAGHYPIGKGGFDIVFKHIVKRVHITRLNDFQKEFHDKTNCYIQRLPVNEYRMDEEHLQEQKKQIEQTIADTKYNEWLKKISKYDYVLPDAC